MNLAKLLAKIENIGAKISKVFRHLERIAKWVAIPAFLAVLAGVIWYASQHDVPVLNPKGEIAQAQYNLLVIASLLSLLVVIPVFALTIFIVWKYRENAKKPGEYKPEWHDNSKLESIWWGVPAILITILSVIIWNSSHKLDPFKELQSSEEPLTVQVVAMQWKWLFIYPDQNIASLNHLVIPEDRPINFQITSDAPMNSFWIPDLGGQIYAMPGMNSELHLIADNPGEFRGVSANISGEGFADMNFTVTSLTQSEFLKWVSDIQVSTDPLLTGNVYSALAEPSTHNPVATYSSVDKNLYHTIMDKYMKPASHDGGEQESESHDNHGAEEHNH